MIENLDRLYEHFLEPVTMRNGHYLPPTRPGYSIQMKAQSLADHELPRRQSLALVICFELFELPGYQRSDFSPCQT